MYLVFSDVFSLKKPELKHKLNNKKKCIILCLLTSTCIYYYYRYNYLYKRSLWLKENKPVFLKKKLENKPVFLKKKLENKPKLPIRSPPFILKKLYIEKIIPTIIFQHEEINDNPIIIMSKYT